MKLRDRFEPRPDRHELYSDRFQQFLEMRELCAPAWRRIAGGPDRGAGSRAKIHG